MPKKDYRVRMSRDKFEAISIDEEYPIDGYFEPLIDRNKRIPTRLLEDGSRIERLTPGQQILILLGGFDSQISNGGITQFFWNCPQSVFAVADALSDLKIPKLLRQYERAVEAWLGKKKRWQQLREEWANTSGDPPWEAFQESYELLDLDWFDEAYLDRWGYKKKVRVRLKRGLQESLTTRLVKYVRSHPEEFISE